jgi:hypothetical protein
MVEIEVRKSEADTEKVESTNIDINEIISKVRSFVEDVRSMSSKGEPMAVNVEGFNFSVGKAGEEYDLKINLNLSFKPKSEVA